tara:strand:+ start:571 stop:783 length:213 start_codon:yes stop_codon:yes gene_type:complete
MNWISAIVALIKAVPILERLFNLVSDRFHEAKAKSRYEEKLDSIDDAMRSDSVPDSEAEQREQADRTWSI